MSWIVLKTAQAEALATVVTEAARKSVLISPDSLVNGSLIVVGSSSYDPRRWDIETDGTITRRDRNTGDRMRGNKFLKRMLVEARRSGANVTASGTSVANQGVTTPEG